MDRAPRDSEEKKIISPTATHSHTIDGIKRKIKLKHTYARARTHDKPCHIPYYRRAQRCASFRRNGSHVIQSPCRERAGGGGAAGDGALRAINRNMRERRFCARTPCAGGASRENIIEKPAAPRVLLVAAAAWLGLAGLLAFVSRVSACCDMSHARVRAACVYCVINYRLPARVTARPFVVE